MKTDRRAGVQTAAKYRNTRTLYAVFAVLSLLLGFAVYYFFRNGDLLFYSWVEAVDLPVFRRQNDGRAPAFLVWLMGSLPDGLWTLSGLMLLRCVLWKNKKLCGVYLIVFCLFALSYELLQISEKIRGTFDPADLCFVIFAIVGERCLAGKLGIAAKRRFL
jgi:hypothetical protein